MVIFPMISAVIGYIIGRKNKKARDIFACAVTAVEFAMAVFMCSKNIVFNLDGIFGLGIEFRDGGLRGILTVTAGFV